MRREETIPISIRHMPLKLWSRVRIAAAQRDQSIQKFVIEVLTERLNQIDQIEEKS